MWLCCFCLGLTVCLLPACVPACQAEATYYGTPRVEAFQIEGSLAGVDLLPLAAAAAPPPAAQPGSGSSSGSPGLPVLAVEGPPALVDGSPVRLRVSGGLALSAVRDDSQAARRQAGLTGGQGYLFTGGQGCWDHQQQPRGAVAATASRTWCLPESTARFSARSAMAEPQRQQLPVAQQLCLQLTHTDGDAWCLLCTGLPCYALMSSVSDIVSAFC